jgi:simple sugar transport system permease protein
MRAVGYSQSGARFAGMPVVSVLLRVALLSGGIAGLAGFNEIAGVKGYLTLDMSPGFGYSGIVVAMLAQLHPAAVVASAIFVAAIFVGADAMSRAVAVPNYIADVIVSVSLLTMMVAMMLTRYRIRHE